MHTDHFFRTIGYGSDLRNGNGRSVAGKDHFRRSCLIQLTENVQLQLDVLRSGFNNQLNAFHTFFDGSKCCDIGQRSSFISLGNHFFRYLALEVFRNGCKSLIEGSLRDINQGNGVTELGKCMRDTISHRSCTDYGNFFHSVHQNSVTKITYKCIIQNA